MRVAIAVKAAGAHINTHEADVKKPKTKVERVMQEFKGGKLHSGSEKGPVVKSRRQAVAIALAEKRKRKS